MSEQDDNLERVSRRIASAIIGFFDEHKEMGLLDFHVEELRRHVRAQVGEIAPASPDRVMRDLRIRRRIGYKVVSRSESLYRICDPRKPPGVEVDLIFPTEPPDFDSGNQGLFNL